jgi:3-deoxy-manno-octulosonate cytidylyltransferase (CMP-KDO synthetase)
MHKVAIVIPARYNSTRLPGKPLIIIKDKPLIQHTIEKVQQCNNIDFISVATDDKRIYNVVKKLGCKVFMTPSICKNGTERVSFVAIHFLKDYDIFINVQGDEPIINPNLINRLVELLKKDYLISCVTAAVPIFNKKLIENSNIVKVVFDKNMHAIYFSRSIIPYNRNRNLNIKYYKHIGIYGYKRDFLIQLSQMQMSLLEQSESLEQLRILENARKIKIILSKQDSIGIDTIQDIKKVEKYL